MQITLLIACESERGTALGEQFTPEETNDILVRTTDPAQLRAEVARAQPHVLLLEHSRGEDARQMLRPLLQLSPATRILLLCETCTTDLMLAFIKLGACGCLLTSDEPSMLVKAVRSVYAGDTWFGRSTLLTALRSLIGTAPAVRKTHVEDGQLTPREEQIFHLVGRGLTNKEVARELSISDHTVKTHLHRIYVKLHQSGRYKAVLSQPNRLTTSAC
jgi:DNA-binding NarL/FixJ family response regulator